MCLNPNVSWQDFPVFSDAQAFLLMLDATIESPFFPRNPDGSLQQAHSLLATQTQAPANLLRLILAMYLTLIPIARGRVEASASLKQPQRGILTLSLTPLFKHCNYSLTVYGMTLLVVSMARLAHSDYGLALLEPKAQS